MGSVRFWCVRGGGAMIVCVNISLHGVVIILWILMLILMTVGGTAGLESVLLELVLAWK